MAFIHFSHGHKTPCSKSKPSSFLLGVLCGTVLFTSGSALATSGVTAVPSSQPIYVDGRQVQMEAYNINGNNYVKLRDIGQAAGFNVYWQDGVQVDTDAAYTGVAPKETASGSNNIDPAAARWEIVDLTNDLRRDNELPALETDSLLMEAAQVRAEEMAAAGLYSHTRPDGSKYYTVTDCRYVTENIHCLNTPWLEAFDLGLASAAVDDWYESTGHRDHMLSDIVDAIGVGVAEGVDEYGQQCWYCVQLFRYKGYQVNWVDSPVM